MNDDADFLSDLRIEPFDTKTAHRRAKEEFFVRRLGEIESEMRYSSALWTKNLNRFSTIDGRAPSIPVSEFWDRFVQENGSVLDD